MNVIDYNKELLKTPKILLVFACFFTILTTYEITLHALDNSITAGLILLSIMTFVTAAMLTGSLYSRKLLKFQKINEVESKDLLKLTKEHVWIDVFIKSSLLTNGYISKQTLSLVHSKYSLFKELSKEESNLFFDALNHNENH
jgi:hypothetical protein